MSVYQKLVGDEENEVRGFVAYGLFERARREWSADFEAQHGTAPSNIDQIAYEGTWTPQVIQNARSSADATLAAYGDAAIADARPDIIEEALRGSAWRSIGLSMAANLIYTLALLGLIIVLRYFGVDLITGLQSLSMRPH